jgi:hypothetical protein
MHIKIVHKCGTADCKRDVLKKHLLFTAAPRCNGMNDTSLHTKCNSLLDPEFYLLLITATGIISCFMWCELLSSS